MTTSTDTCATAEFALRYFLTYRGKSLPLNLCEELAEQDLRHRNTYFRAVYNIAGQIARLERIVYGEVDLRHDYAWSADGVLMRATITDADEVPRTLEVNTTPTSNPTGPTADLPTCGPSLTHLKA